MTTNAPTDLRWTHFQHGCLWEASQPVSWDPGGIYSGSTIETSTRCHHCTDTTPRLMIELQESIPYESPGVIVCRSCLAAMLAALDRAPEMLAAPATEDKP